MSLAEISQVLKVLPGYFQPKKDERKPKENYLTFFHSKDRKKDRHKLSFKTRHWVRFFKQENYFLTSLEEILKQTLSGGCGAPYLSLYIENKNLFFLKHYPADPYHSTKQKDYLFSHLVWREQEELEKTLKEKPRQFGKKWQDIKLKTEILSKWDNPAKLVAGYRENGRPRPTRDGVGWNSPNYWEPKNRSLAALAFTHEIVLGKVDVPLLDLDPNKQDGRGNYRIESEGLRKALVVGGSEWKKLIDRHQIPYYWTTGTPGNCLLPIPYWLVGSMKGAKIYHQDTGEKIGDLLSEGDLVALPVGGDKNRQLVITDWGKKLVEKYGVAGIFNKKILSGKVEERVEEVLNRVGLSLSESVQKSKSREKLVKKETEKAGSFSFTSTKKPPIEAFISGSQKTCLEDIWKVFYLDWKTKTKGYFLVNSYQRNLEDLVVGKTMNIRLVQGWKHEFFSRVV